MEISQLTSTCIILKILISVLHIHTLIYIQSFLGHVMRSNSYCGLRQCKFRRYLLGRGYSNWIGSKWGKKFEISKEVKKFIWPHFSECWMGRGLGRSSIKGSTLDPWTTWGLRAPTTWAQIKNPGVTFDSCKNWTLIDSLLLTGTYQ